MDTLRYRLKIFDTTDSASITGGAVQVAGGVGITKSMSIGGTLNVNSDIQMAASSKVIYPIGGLGAPTFTTRSAGTRFVIWPNVTGSSTDYAIGINNETLWHSVGGNASNYSFKWYGGTANVMTLTGDGMLTLLNSVNPTITLQSTGFDAPDGGDIKFLENTGAYGYILRHNMLNSINDALDIVRFYNNVETLAVRISGTGVATTTTIMSTIDSTSATTGALQVAGGMHLGKTLHMSVGTSDPQPSAIKMEAPAGAIYGTGIFLSNNASNSTQWGLYHAGSTGTGGLLSGCLGFYSFGINKHILQLKQDGTVQVAVTTDSTSMSSGVLQVSGGVGIAKSLWAGSAGSSARFMNDSPWGQVKIAHTTANLEASVGFYASTAFGTAAGDNTWVIGRNVYGTSAGELGIAHSATGLLTTWASDGTVIISGQTIKPDGITVNGTLRSTVDNTNDLGTSAFRWKTVYAANGVVTTSDERYKRDIQTLRVGLDFVNRLEPIEYILNEDNKGIKRMGFGARNTKKIMDEMNIEHGLIEASDSGSWGMNYEQLIPILVNCIKEMSLRLDRIEKTRDGKCDK